MTTKTLPRGDFPKIGTFECDACGEEATGVLCWVGDGVWKARKPWGWRTWKRHCLGPIPYEEEFDICVACGKDVDAVVEKKRKAFKRRRSGKIR